MNECACRSMARPMLAPAPSTRTRAGQRVAVRCSVTNARSGWRGGGLLTTGGCDTRTRGGVRAGGDVGLLSRKGGVWRKQADFSPNFYYFLLLVAAQQSNARRKRTKVLAQNVRRQGKLLVGLLTVYVGLSFSIKALDQARLFCPSLPPFRLVLESTLREKGDACPTSCRQHGLDGGVTAGWCSLERCYLRSDRRCGGCCCPWHCCFAARCSR